MIRERRSIWGSISMSEKVNALSLPAAILYVFTISHLDDFGFIEASPMLLKVKTVPLRREITERNINKYIKEILNIHIKVGSPDPLWILHERQGRSYIQDPYFEERQTFHGIRRVRSKIKDLIENTRSGVDGCQDGAIMVHGGCDTGAEKLDIGEGVVQNGFISEVKGSEVKGREGEADGCGVTTPSPALHKPSGKRKVKNDDLETIPINGTLNAKAFADLYNDLCPNLAQVKELRARAPKIRTRLKERPDREYWESVFKKSNLIEIEERSNHPAWKPDFDWLIVNAYNSVKVYEGKYDDLIMHKMSGGQSGALKYAIKEGLFDESGREPEPEPEE
jgi:hypothetical protein